jgi:crotonobetainyl-CoA:carnitine CoA-transferase CaiB-like acyl-CoA transferase
MGAEVIKIERLGGEETRYHAPWVRKQSAYWVQYNSGKKSVSMDLRKEEGKEALRKLVKISDVLVQNFRPGTIEKMGFGYDVLKNLYPRIIMVNVSAYGQFGPYRDQIGYDPIGQTMSGIAMVTGEEDMPPLAPWLPSVSGRFLERVRPSTSAWRIVATAIPRSPSAPIMEPESNQRGTVPLVCTPARTAGC